MRPEVPLLVLAEQHAEVQRGCIETLTEEEREKLDGFLLKCHRPQKRKNRCLTVYADSAEIFRAKRRQREFALLQSKAPKTETKRNAKVRKGKEPKELDNDEQAATARADSPAAASPAKRSPPASLFDLKLKGTANQHSFEKEMKEINAARPDDEQHQQQQVETPKHLENMIEETKMEEDGLTSKPPNLQPLEAQDIQEAAYELNESRRSVTASRRSSPRRLEAKSHEASSETRSASSCAVEPHEVNVGEDEAQGDQQTAVRQTPLKNHIKRKQVKKEERQKKQKQTEGVSEKEEKRKSGGRGSTPRSHASKEQNRKRAKTTSSVPASEISPACEKKQTPKGRRKALNPLKAARAAAAAVHAQELKEEMKRLAACNGRRRSCVLVYALQSQAKV